MDLRYIEHMFREMGLADLTDEPGSGVGNTHKYSMLYSGDGPGFRVKSKKNGYLKIKS